MERNTLVVGTPVLLANDRIISLMFTSIISSLDSDGQREKKVLRDAVAASQPSVCLLYRAMELRNPEEPEPRRHIWTPHCRYCHH